MGLLCAQGCESRVLLAFDAVSSGSSSIQRRSQLLQCQDSEPRGSGIERVPVAEEVLQLRVGHGAIDVGEGGVGVVMEEVRHVLAMVADELVVLNGNPVFVQTAITANFTFGP